MREELFAIGVIGALGISVVALIVMIWIRPRKGGPGWIMAASTIVCLAGFVAIGALALEEFGIAGRRSRSHEEELIGIALGFWCLTALLFAVGFLLDRIRRSREQGGR